MRILASTSIVVGRCALWRRANLIQLLTLLLLTSVFWGAVGEFTHNHNFARRRSPIAFGAQAGSPSAEVDKVQSAETSGVLSKTRTAADCLICQLHQNLSTTAFDQVSPIAATEKQSLRSPAESVFHQTDFSTDCRGRAPPTLL
jgi:hypothetical protein